MTVPLHVLNEGEPGAPLVAFAHGLEDTWQSWRPIAGWLGPRRRLVALDLPWRAGNDYRWRHRSPADWLRSGLAALPRTPDVLVAHSFGGNAALQLLCADEPLAGRAVALICPLYRPPGGPVTWALFDRSRETFVQHIHDGLRARMGSRATRIDAGLLAAMTDLAIERVGPAGFLTVFEQYLATADLSLDAVGRPVAVLAGGADPTLTPKAAQVLAAGMPGGLLHLRDDYDHFCHVRHAQQIADRVADLARLARATMGTAG
ncbi:alpha/beta fold hydrolase [Micromonospora sp. NPDC047644]|uniref:alpha/beta fold hydrolase n=1 Tax=Micromonospora sp. NPDC047644 TaxID=3157203 RepID=UPI0034527EDD